MKTLLTIVLLIAVAPWATPAAAVSRRACRIACRPPVASRCAGLFGTSARCRARVLRACRVSGTAQCDEARACLDSCGTIVTQCEKAATPVTPSGGNFGVLEAEVSCSNFAFERCVQHGVEFCSAPETHNGCNRVAAEDHRGEPLVTVTFSFDGVAYDYAPECILVSAGTTVRFAGLFEGGSFTDEPLVGGDAPVADPESPFSPLTTSGTSRDFLLTQPGTYPYFGGDFGQDLPSRLLGTGLPWGAVIVDAAD